MNTDEAETILLKIQQHKEVYEMAKLEVPPYRLTYAENLILNLRAIAYLALSEDKKYDLISYYYGVPIEIVVPIK